MDFVIFDLEWNGAYSKRLNCNINEIIEIGAVKLDSELNKKDEFSILIRPELSKKLSSPVMELTSITNEDLAHGVPFRYAYSKFRKFSTGCVMMTWSTSDIEALVWNLKYHYGTDRIDFMQKYADLQQYCHDMLGIEGNNALGLQSAADMLKIDTNDILKHRALDDSIVSGMCLKKMSSIGSVEPYIVSADDSFYEKLFFHPYYITDLSDENIDHSQLYFDCPECGRRAERKKNWEEKLKSLVSLFQCPFCGYSFKGRVQIKKKYDGITVSKKLIPLQSKKNDK